MCQNIKRVLCLLLVAAFVVLSAPEFTKTAVAASWKLIVNPETALDKVYFYSEERDGVKDYFYGYIDGKVAVLDGNLKLVKKTEYSGIGCGKTYNGKRYYSVDKKVGKETKQGIMDERGNTFYQASSKYAGVLSFSDYATKKEVFYINVSDEQKATLYTMNKQKAIEYAVKPYSYLGVYNGVIYSILKDTAGNEFIKKGADTIYTFPADSTSRFAYFSKVKNTDVIECSYQDNRTSKRVCERIDFNGKKVETEPTVGTTVVKNAVKTNVNTASASGWQGVIGDTIVVGEYTFIKNKTGDNLGYYSASKGGKVVCDKASVSSCWSDFGSYKSNNLVRVNNSSSTGVLKSFVYDMNQKKTVYQVKKSSEVINGFHNIEDSSWIEISQETINKKMNTLASTKRIITASGKVKYERVIPYKTETKNGATYQSPKAAQSNLIVIPKKKRVYVFEGVQRATVKNVKYVLTGEKAKVVGYTGKKKSLTITDYLKINAKKYPVTAIGKKAFSKNKKLKKLTVKTKKLSSVSSSAFKGTKKGLVVKVPKSKKKKYIKLFKKSGNKSIKVK